MQFLVFCLDLDGPMLLKWILMRMFGEVGVDWIHRPQDVGKWRAFVNMVMNNDFIKLRAISSLAKELSALQEGLYFMELFV